MKERKPYQKPAVIFEKDLEALASVCGGALSIPNIYNGGGGQIYCKSGTQGCTGFLNS